MSASHTNGGSATGSAAPAEPSASAASTAAPTASPRVAAGADVSQVLAALQRGTSILKYCRRGKPHHRFFSVSDDGLSVNWRSKRKKPQATCVQLRDIERIQRGRHTSKFARQMASGARPDDSEELRSFSIIHGDDETLDLTFDALEQCEVWYFGLQRLIAWALRGGAAAPSVGPGDGAMPGSAAVGTGGGSGPGPPGATVVRRVGVTSLVDAFADDEPVGVVPDVMVVHEFLVGAEPPPSAMVARAAAALVRGDSNVSLIAGGNSNGKVNGAGGSGSGTGSGSGSAGGANVDSGSPATIRTGLAGDAGDGGGGGGADLGGVGGGGNSNNSSGGGVNVVPGDLGGSAEANARVATAVATVQAMDDKRASKGLPGGRRSRRRLTADELATTIDVLLMHHAPGVRAHRDGTGEAEGSVTATAAQSATGDAFSVAGVSTHSDTGGRRSPSPPPLSSRGTPRMAESGAGVFGAYAGSDIDDDDTRGGSRDRDISSVARTAAAGSHSERHPAASPEGSPRAELLSGVDTADDADDGGGGRVRSVTVDSSTTATEVASSAHSSRGDRASGARSFAHGSGDGVRGTTRDGSGHGDGSRDGDGSDAGTGAGAGAEASTSSALVEDALAVLSGRDPAADRVAAARAATAERWTPPLLAVRRSYKEVKRILRRVRILREKAYLKRLFVEVAGDAGARIDVVDFLDFVGRLRDRPDLRAVFDTLVLSPQCPWVTPAGFLHFLHTQQQETRATLADATAIMARFQPNWRGERLYASAFATYLSSDGNRVFAPESSRPHQDMTQPLSHYWIESSHNTYLEGDQLTGYSSVNQYINAVTKGCRCVELDCWDGPDGEPVIYHGRTLTSRIRFADVIHALRRFGFKVSPYPLILSLENHCSLAQQARMAAILVEELGDLLVRPSEFPGSTVALPSPEELRGRVIVKGKAATRLVREGAGASGGGGGGGGGGVSGADSSFSDGVDGTPIPVGGTYAHAVTFGAGVDGKAVAAAPRGGVVAPGSSAAHSGSPSASASAAVSVGVGGHDGGATEDREPGTWASRVGGSSSGTGGGSGSGGSGGGGGGGSTATEGGRIAGRGPLSFLRRRRDSATAAAAAEAAAAAQAAASASTAAAAAAGTSVATTVTLPGVMGVPGTGTGASDRGRDTTTDAGGGAKTGQSRSLSPAASARGVVPAAAVAAPPPLPPASVAARRHSAPDDARGSAASAAAAAAAAAAVAKAPKTPVAPALSDVIFLIAVKFENFEVSRTACLPVHMTSFQEPKFEKLSRRGHGDLLLYHTRQLSRVYPSRLRVDSSNFNPFLGWSAGSQMVALNYQTPGLHLQLNKARFRANGRSGYVLKPWWMRTLLTLPSTAGGAAAGVSGSGTSADAASATSSGGGGGGGGASTGSGGDAVVTSAPASPATSSLPSPAGPVGAEGDVEGAFLRMDPDHVVAGSVERGVAQAQAGSVAPPTHTLLAPDGPDASALVLVVTLMSGHQLPSASGASKGDSIDPYCVVRMCGDQGDERRHRSSTVTNNGLNPTWQQTFRFPLSEPSLAILHITVFDAALALGRDNFVAYFASPVDCIRAGYRSCRLRSRTGKKLHGCSLVCHFAVEPAVDA